jgi:hypothetical protein
MDQSLKINFYIVCEYQCFFFKLIYVIEVNFDSQRKLERKSLN